MLKEMEALVTKGLHFRHRLDQFRLPLRYALMALLSEKKVLLFNSSILKLMDLLIEKKWNANEGLASYSAFMIDKMQY